MGSIHPLAQQRIFDPDTAHAMGLAFETAWQKLLGSRSELAFSTDADRTREAVGKAWRWPIMPHMPIMPPG